MSFKAGISRHLLELAISEISLASAARLSASPIGPALVVGLVLWWGLQWGVRSAPALVRPLVIGTGVAFLAQAILAYADWGAMRISFFLGACAGSSALILGARWAYGSKRSPETVLLINCSSMTPGTTEAIRLSGVKIVEADNFEALQLAIQSMPARIVTPARDWEKQIPPRFLLNCKSAGVQLETDVMLQERLLERVPPESIQPIDLLWSETLRETRPMMAVQSIYTNLIGLLLIAALWPLLLIAGLAARLAAGPGPLFERVECAGFQGIPFFRRGFRIKHAATGEWTRVGRLLTSLRLRGLPQLINLVRGEMGLFGPQPVRAVFAGYLDRVSPVFSRRLSVKPGIFGWAQAHGGPATAGMKPLASEIQEEGLRIAYDLYYLEFGSPLMDLEILTRTLFRPILGPRAR